MIDDLAVDARTAHDQPTRGWVAHTACSLETTPPSTTSTASGPPAAAAVVGIRVEHYLFTGDQNFCAAPCPGHEGASSSLLSALVSDPKTRLARHVYPSFSRNRCPRCYGPTMDNPTHSLVAGHNFDSGGANPEQRTKTSSPNSKKPATNVRQTKSENTASSREWLDDVDSAEKQTTATCRRCGRLYPGRGHFARGSNISGRRRSLLLKWRRRRQHRLEFRLAHPALGAHRRRRIRLRTINRPVAKAHTAEHVRPVRPVPD